MKQFEKKRITTKLNANPVLLFSIWLLLIFIPYVLVFFVVDNILKESEDRLLLRVKSQLIESFNDFKDHITSISYINNKLSGYPKNKESKKYSALDLKLSLERYLKSKIVCLFYYDEQEDVVDVCVSNEQKEELGMVSKRLLKNLFNSLSSDDDAQLEKCFDYIRNILFAAGGVNIKYDNAAYILSGKEKLGRLIGFCKVFTTEDEKKHHLMFLLKEKDIPVQEIIKNAASPYDDVNYKRSVAYLNRNNNSIATNSVDLEDLLLYKFSKDDNELSIFGKIPEELIIRLGTQNTFYPSNIDTLKENTPVLKVSVNNSELEHPMRYTIRWLKFPMLLLLLFSSFVLIRVEILGYTGNIRILGRVVLCILAATIIPFTMFIIAAFYNQYFYEEYSENEIQRYVSLQNSIVLKAIDGYINNKELSVTKLRNNIDNLPVEEVKKKLSDWLTNSGASAISFNYGDNQEIEIIGNDVSEKISNLGLEVKKISNIGMKNVFSENDLSNIKSLNDLNEHFRFRPQGIGVAVSNIGKIYSSIENEPSTLYSLFPIFNNQNYQNELMGTVLVKFVTYKIINDFRIRMPEYLNIKNMGNYIIRTAIIPLSEDGLIPDYNKAVTSTFFPIDNVKQMAKRIMNGKNSKSWVNANSINVGTYHNGINAVVINSAEKISKEDSLFTKDLGIIALYLLFLIVALSLILNGIVVSPIKQLQEASGIVGSGDYTKKIECNSRDEFEKLGLAFNGMTNALLQKEMMTNYVSQEVIKEVSNNEDNQLQPGGERINVSVLFCALESKKALIEYTPEEVTDIISCMVDTVDDISTSYNGQIDKLIEDTVMVVFREKNDGSNIALNCCKAALDIVKNLEKDLPEGFKIKVGIATGYVVSGKIGSKNGKLDFTVIGNPVNLAARLKVQASKANETGILICPNTIRKSHGCVKIKYLERVAIKGRTNRTFPLYELEKIRG